MGRERVYESTAAREAAYRERKNLGTFTVQLPAELLADFEEYLRFKNVSKSEVIEKLIKTQLLRKR